MVGKSTILSYLAQQYGARVIELDKAAHLCMQPGTSCYEQIVDRFGKKILKEDGSIDRPVLSRIVFADRQEVEALNHMVHPAGALMEIMNEDGTMARLPELRRMADE